MKALLVLLFVTVSFAQKCKDSYGREYSENEDVISYETWLRCQYGELRVQGCLYDGQRLALGQTVDTSGYVMTCTKLSEETTHMKPTACIKENRPILPGESVKDQFFVYSCRTQGSDGIRLETTACVDPEGREVAPGYKFVRGEYQYQCGTSSGHLALEPVGCLYDGMEYPAGTTFNGEKFYFTCERKGNMINRRIDGCLDQNGQRVHAGGRFHKNGYVMTCQQLNYGFATKVTGCLEDLGGGNVREHPVGSQWIQGTEPFTYTVYCTTCTDGYTVMKSLTKCKLGGGPAFVRGQIYAKPDPNTELEPGCMRPDGSKLACCGTTPGGGLQLHMDEYNSKNIDKWRQLGYRMC